MTEETANAGEAAANPRFGMKRIYVKDLSFESPLDIASRTQGKPAVEQDLHTVISKVAEDHFEVLLQLTVTVKQEDKVAFLAEVHQAGLFQVDGMDEARLQHTLSSVCPSILFPYAREAIDSMAVRGGFAPLMLPPINFDAVYAKALSEARAKAETRTAGSEAH